MCEILKSSDLETLCIQDMNAYSFMKSRFGNDEAFKGI